MLPSKGSWLCLETKSVGQFLVKNLVTPKTANSTTFKDKLQLNPQSKKLIEHSIRAHEDSKRGEDGKTKGLEDFAPGKRKGLVIMLYGKFSTARLSLCFLFSLFFFKPSWSTSYICLKVTQESPG